MTTATVEDKVVPSRVVPFRAGRVPGQLSVATLEELYALPPYQDPELAEAVTARTLLADVSEFQPNVVDAKYLAWSKAIVIRCAYGDAHDDLAWYGGARRADLHKGGVKFLGIYQYLVSGQDPVAQADAFHRIVGNLQGGELPICDLEEGSGNQWSRWAAWRDRINSYYPQLRKTPAGGPWLYTGLDFGLTHGLSEQWVAAYQSAEPTTPHKLWQFTDAFNVPGVGPCDCSVAHMTVDQLAAYTVAAQPPAKPLPPLPSGWTQKAMSDLPDLHEGESDRSGHWDVHTLQGLLGARNHPVTIDGLFGPTTKNRVQAFQSDEKLPVNGVVDSNTWAKLIQPS